MTHVPVATVTRELASWAAHLRYEDIPSDVVALAKRQIVDTLAVAWAGTGADCIEPVVDMVLGQGGRPQSRVWGHEARIAAPQAAFLNGMFAAALDFDSLHDASTLHPDAVVLPAAMALGEWTRADGRTLIAALVAGSEVALRLGTSAKANPGWFFASVFGIFGAAAAAARILGLDGERTLHAMGIAMNQAAGTEQPLLERALAKRFQTAMASRNGVEAALLARAGVTGPTQPFDGSRGISSLYTAMDLSGLCKGLGHDYEVRSVGLKKYASCMCNQAPIEAVLRLLAQGSLRPEDIEEIEATVSAYTDRLAGAPFEPGASPQVSAQFSVRYSIASALLRHRFDVADIAADMVRDSAVAALARRVRLTVDEQAGRFAPATVAIRLKDGSRRQARVDVLPGSAQAPLSDAELCAKAKSCMARARHPVSESDVDLLIAAVNCADECPDVNALARFYLDDGTGRAVYLQT